MEYLNSLTSIMWANNETGVISPIKEIIDIVKTDDTLYIQMLFKQCRKNSN